MSLTAVLLVAVVTHILLLVLIAVIVHVEIGLRSIFRIVSAHALLGPLVGVH